MNKHEEMQQLHAAQREFLLREVKQLRAIAHHCNVQEAALISVAQDRARMVVKELVQIRSDLQDGLQMS